MMWKSNNPNDEYKRTDVAEIPGDSNCLSQKILIFCDPYERIWYMNYWIDDEIIDKRVVLAANDWETARKKAEYLVYLYLEKQQLKWRGMAWHFDQRRFNRE